MSERKLSYGVRGGFVQRFTLFCCTLFLAGLLSIAAHAASTPRLVLMLGDSLTAGYGLPAGQSVPARLEAQLKAKGYAVRVHNGGVSGDTSAQGRARLGWLLKSLGRTPDVVIVELGANDMLRGLPPKEAETHLNAIMQELQKRKIKIILSGMLAAPNLGPAYAKEFNAIYPRLAKKYGATLDPFYMQDIAAQPAFLLSDKIHPNAQGAEKIAKRLAPLVKKLLGPPK